MAIFTGYDTVYDYLKNVSIPDGNHTLTVNGVGIAIEMVNFNTDMVYASNPALGSATADTAMLVLRYSQNLTINAGVIVTPQVRKRGMTIYVGGVLDNKGTISMSARGASAAGQDVFLYKSTKGVFEVIPAAGAALTAQASQGSETSGHTTASAGKIGTGRQTGGGAPGAGRGAAGGTGAAGTSYSGGSGGGGNNNGKGGNSDGKANGGAGGDAFTTSSFSHSAGGGAGNLGGLGAAGNRGDGINGANGTGGLLIIYANELRQGGALTSTGSAGGSGYRAGGGGSGGGSINVFFQSAKFSSSGIYNVAGGANGAGTRGAESGDGGLGGAGTVTLFSLKEERVVTLVGGTLVPASNVYDMELGNAIPCYYEAPLSGLGRFVDLGTSADSALITTGSTTPAGTFNFVYAGDDMYGRKLLIADRNIQTGVTWNMLNEAGVIDGLELYRFGDVGIASGLVYVDAVNGSDSNDGNISSPVKTLNKAITVAKVSGVILLSEGVHTINTVNMSLHDLSTTKGLTYIGKGKNTVIEVPFTPTNSNPPTGSSAYFYDMVIRPSNNLSGDARAIWYASTNSPSVYRLRFTNVSFTKSLNNSYPTTWYMIWAPSGTVAPHVLFVNCSFVAVPSAVELNGSATARYRNCVFGNAASGVTAGTYTTSVFGATFDSDMNVTSTATVWRNVGTGTNPDGTVANLGVYGGTFMWGVYDVTKTELDLNIKLTLRLMTGGTSSFDTGNEWSEQIQFNTLDGLLTAGNNAVWNWTVGSWTSSTALVTPANRVTRGGAAAGAWNSVAGTSTAGFRPILILDFRSVPSFVGGVDRTSIHSEAVQLKGTISDSMNYPVQYSISVNRVKVYPEGADKYTDLQDSPANVSYLIPNSYFNFGSNQVTLTIKNQFLTRAYAFTVNLTSQAPTINASILGMGLAMEVTDAEGDNIQFNVQLNGKRVFPVELDKEFTDMKVAPVSYSRSFLSNEVIIGQDNLIKVTAKDKYGATSSVTLTFIGEYSELMFADETGNFYSTDLGLILQYLDVGVLLAGQISQTYPVRLINKLGFPVTNVTLSKDDKTLPSNVFIEISQLESPFVPESPFVHQGIMNYNDEFKFFVRIVTTLSSNPGQGEFDIYVTGDPV